MAANTGKNALPSAKHPVFITSSTVWAFRFLWYSNPIQSSGLTPRKLSSTQAWCPLCCLRTGADLGSSTPPCLLLRLRFRWFVGRHPRRSLTEGGRGGVLNYVERRTRGLLAPKSLGGICCIFVDRVMNVVIVSCRVHMRRDLEPPFWPIDSPRCARSHDPSELPTWFWGPLMKTLWRRWDSNPLPPHGQFPTRLRPGNKLSGKANEFKDTVTATLHDKIQTNLLSESSLCQPGLPCALCPSHAVHCHPPLLAPSTQLCCLVRAARIRLVYPDPGADRCCCVPPRNPSRQPSTRSATMHRV